MAYDVIVIGGGPAGLSAAVNIRARGKQVLVVSNPLEENPLWRAERIDNCLGLPGLSGKELLTLFQRHALDAGAELRVGRVVSAMPSGEDWFVSIGQDVEQAGGIILAAGAVRGKKLPGEAELLGHGVSYCATCDGMLYRGRKVAVLGWTPSAKHEAEFLEEIGCQVVYFDKPSACSIQGENRVESVTCDGKTEPVEGVFLLRAAMAPTDLFPGLKMENGYVKVARDMSTNLPNLYACGDCTGAPHQISKALGEAQTASLTFLERKVSKRTFARSSVPGLTQPSATAT